MAGAFAYSVGQVYVRYSVDSTHWTSWQALQLDDETAQKNRLFIYKGFVSVPRMERKNYEELRWEYMKMDVPWKSDEEATAKWILSKDSKFFEKSIPFVGYIQFLYEQNFRPGQRLTSFKAELDYSMGGKSAGPKDPNVLKERGSIPWRFKAE